MTPSDVLLCKLPSKSYSWLSSYSPQVIHYAVSLHYIHIWGNIQPYSHYGNAGLRAL